MKEKPPFSCQKYLAALAPRRISPPLAIDPASFYTRPFEGLMRAVDENTSEN